MGDFKQFKSELDALTASYKADVANTKSQWESDVQETVDGYNPSPELKKALEEISSASHTAFQDVLNRSQEYLDAVTKLYDDTYGQEPANKPVGTPEQPIHVEPPSGSTKPVNPDRPQPKK